MNATKFRALINSLAESCSVLDNLPCNSAFILPPSDQFFFDRTEDNFYGPSFDSIAQNPHWSAIFDIPHPEFSHFGYSEVQSASSTMALLMSIFCNPEGGKRKELAAMFRMDKIQPADIKFGHCVELESKSRPSVFANAELLLKGSCFCKAYLAEDDMGDELKEDLMELRDFSRVFAVGYLPQNNNSYLYSELIRGILAAWQSGHDFRFITDIRRTDLISGFYKLASCIIDVSFRTKCKPIFWQDIAGVSGPGLQEYLKEKYEITE